MGNQVNMKAKFVNLLSQNEESALAEELKQILILDISQEDYLSSFYPSDIRDIMKQSPSRIAGILNYIHNFLCDTNSQLAANIQYRQWKNCLRILTSIIPVLYEQQFKEVMRNMLWYTKIPQPNEDLQERDPPLILSLLKRLVQMCFIFGFTIDTVEKSETVINNDTLLLYFRNYYHKGWNSYDLKVDLIWKGFNPQCKYPNDIGKYFENRYLVLSCILALVSQTLFQTEQFYQIEEPNQQNHLEQEEQKIKVEKLQPLVQQQENQVEIEKKLHQHQKPQQQNQQHQHQHQQQKLNSKQSILEENNKDDRQNEAKEKQIKKFIVQVPNAALLAIQKMPFFPELFASLIGISLFPTERIKQFIKNITNISSSNEENLMNVSLELISLIIGGQGLVYKDASQQGEYDNQEMKLACEHFRFFNCPFPQLINLPTEIQQNIISYLTAKFYSYYKSQQQFLRGTFEKQLSQFDSNFILLSYLLLRNQEAVPNVINVYLLSYFSSKKYIKKMATLMLKQLSAQSQINKQLCIAQEFTLTFTDAPLIIGTWGDLLVYSLCNDLLQQINNIKVKHLNNITIIIFNMAQEIGTLNKTSSFMLCKLLRSISNYDTLLKSPLILMSAVNLTIAISMMLYYNPDHSFELLYQTIQIIDSIKFIANLTITKGKLQVWWNKHVAQNPIINQSFVKSKQYQDDVHEIRDSQVRSVTQQQQFGSVKKYSQQIPQEEIQSLQQIEQIQSERTQKQQSEFFEYLEQWKELNYDSLKQQPSLISLSQLIENLLKLVKDQKNEKELHQVLEAHDLKSLMQKQVPVKIFVEKFESYKKITKLIWTNCLRNSGKFPYFEKSECPCFIKQYLAK